MKKIGLLALALVLALGALGVGYAAWTDTIFISGTVNTGSVDLNVVDYSGTYIYKVPGLQPDEIWVYRGPLTVPFEPPAGAIEIAYATALPDGEDAIEVTFYNAFPCQDLTADFLVKYEGTIPVKVDAYLTGTCTDLTPNNTIDDCAVLAQYFVVNFYESDEAGTKGDPITDVVQMHEGDYAYCEATLHLPQDNTLMNLGCSFTAEIFAVQWNEYPYTPAP